MLKELLYDYKVPSDKKVTDFDVKVSNIQVVRDFIQSWHYSKSVNGLRISHVFGLYCDDTLIGAMIYGPLGCLLYTSPSPRDEKVSRMPSSA